MDSIELLIVISRGIANEKRSASFSCLYFPKTSYSRYKSSHEYGYLNIPKDW